jgi:hypothetical protein
LPARYTFISKPAWPHPILGSEKNVPSFWKPTGRGLARHLTRLGQGLQDLTRRLRESVAATIGRVADEAAQEAVQALLGDSTSPPTRTQDRWGGRQENIDRFNDSWSNSQWDDIEDDDLPGELPEQSVPQPPGWQRALLAGCRVAVCWLRRFDRYPLLYAIGLGLLAGIASWVGGPLAEAGSGLVTSAMGLADLASTLHSGSSMSTA